MSADKLTSPFPGLREDDAEYLHAKIPKPLFDYFFRKVLPGDRGCRQILVQCFFQKLYEQCQLTGIEPNWDPGNEGRVSAIISRLNFDDVAAIIREGNRIGKYEPVPRPERPSSPGRARKSTPKSSSQPKGHADERAGTPLVGSTPPDPSNLSSHP